jgi:hypothetical protein
MDARDDLKGALGAFILFGAVAAIGVVTAYAAVEDYARARASLGWPTVEGVVLSNESGDDVRYAWFDGEASHTGERIRFWTGALHRSGEVYAPGRRVAVRVSPDDGSIAVIEPGGSPVLFLIVLAFGGFLVFLGLAGVIRLTMLLDGLAPRAADPDFGFAPAE